MFSGWDRPSHWLVLAVVVLVLFGYKKLPDMSRSVGRSLRIFKSEMKGLNEDDVKRDAEPPATPERGTPAATAPDAPAAAPTPVVVPPNQTAEGKTPQQPTSN
jgi:sec-independent protein translocase protein TatA